MTAAFNVACAEAQEKLLDLLDELSSEMITTEYYNLLELLGEDLAIRRAAIEKEFLKETFSEASPGRKVSFVPRGEQ